MGCASSNPLVDAGKNALDTAKDTSDNVVAMGEKAMHDAGDAVNSGVEHVKSAVQSGLSSAQDTLGSVVHNIEDTIGSAKESATDTIEAVDDNLEDALDETISDAKTVLAFEDAISVDTAKDEFGESVQQVQSHLEETLHLEDIEHDTVVEEVKVQAEEVKEAAVEVAEATPPAEEDKKEEEPPLTPWEAAVDEIFEMSRLKSQNSQTRQAAEEDSDTDTEQTLNEISDNLKSDTSKSDTSKADNSENYDKDVGGNNTSDILLSDTLSIKSYKSEI